MLLDMGSWFVSAIFYLIISHSLCLGFWKFWNTDEFLVLLRIGFWEENVAGIIESIFGRVPSIILVLREKNAREHNLKFGVRLERTTFQNTTPLINTFMRETFLLSLPHYFSSPFPPTIELQILVFSNFPIKLYEKYFQSSNCITKYVSF